jgi:hypothetical protein
MGNLKSKIRYLVLTGLFLVALTSFLPFRLMVGRYQVSPFWCLSIPILGILLMLVLNQESFNTFALPKRLSLFVGVLIASIHFTIFFFLLDSRPFICSSPSLLSAFPLAPTHVLVALPIASDIASLLLQVLRINEDFFVVFVSSCGYGLAGGLLVSRQRTYRIVGLILIGSSILVGFYLIWMAIGTGCGT